MRQVLHTSVLSQETCKSLFYGFVCIRPDFSTSVLDIEIYFIFPWSPCDDCSVADEGPREGRRLSLRQRGERRRGLQPELQPGVGPDSPHGWLVQLSPANTSQRPAAPGGEVREPPQYRRSHWDHWRILRTALTFSYREPARWPLVLQSCLVTTYNLQQSLQQHSEDTSPVLTIK